MGGFEEAIQDFESMGPLNVREIKKEGKTIRIGDLPNGESINVRNSSHDKRPTLEIYKNKRSIKIRYGLKNGK